MVSLAARRAELEFPADRSLMMNTPSVRVVLVTAATLCSLGGWLGPSPGQGSISNFLLSQIPLVPLQWQNHLPLSEDWINLETLKYPVTVVIPRFDLRVSNDPSLIKLEINCLSALQDQLWICRCWEINFMIFFKEIVVE